MSALGRTGTSTRWRSAGALLVAVAALVAGGCVNKSVIAPATFAIDPPAPRSGPPPADGVVLSLSRVDVVAPYAGNAFVYRFGDHRIERDPYARFAASPGWMITAAIRGYLRNAPFVQDVVTPGGGLPASLAIEASAGELYGDFSEAQAASVVALHFRVLTPPGGALPIRELFQKDYSRRVPIAERTPAALADGWNRAVAGVMEAFIADLQPVVATSVRAAVH